MSSSLSKIITLMGPTASGKTDLAIFLTEHFPVDIISVDSALVYKGLDIGSAKPCTEELAKAPHRLLDIRDVTSRLLRILLGIAETPAENLNTPSIIIAKDLTQSIRSHC